MLKCTEESIILRAPKRLDALTAPHLAKDLDSKIQEGARVVLDLSNTQMIAPETTEVVLQGLMLAKQRNARFSLRGVNPQVQVVLDMTGVLQYFRKS